MFYIEQTEDISGNISERKQTEDINGNSAAPGRGGLHQLIDAAVVEPWSGERSTREARVFYHLNPMEEAEKPEEETLTRLTDTEIQMKKIKNEQLDYARRKLTKKELKMLKEEKYQDTSEAQFQKTYACSQMSRKQRKHARWVARALESKNEEINLCYNGKIHLNGETDMGISVKMSLYIPLTFHQFAEEKIYLNAEDEFQHTMSLPAEETLELRVINPKKRTA